MAAVTPRDIEDIKKMVKKKLELYINREKRENLFDPSGACRTTRKMYKYDLMYKVINYDVFDKQSPRYKNRKKKGKHETPVEYDHKTEKDKHKKRESSEGGKSEPRGADVSEEFENMIYPHLEDTTRRVTLYREADRITKYANEVYDKYNMEHLQTIHHFRPSSEQDHVNRGLDSGYLHNYTRHVGSILHAKTYVDFYKKEGLHTGDKSKSKRLQELPTKKPKEPESDKPTPKEETEQ
ncbi:uncharacterized protein LOC110465255 [Mizuhopecten yessoensis]|uniref:Uncharacterized protein n=1 Tax=Mizuhopecten yessoensis TaxID=6573 RepID=A0A210PRX9_MIZYE|nr:uncharacterized protein LOC110465255 [Mizuhopecten yessoensis]OWF39250.1 hypothetical protein KP79_PYT20743 [Mizuhopecten yessoensis]